MEDHDRVRPADLLRHPDFGVHGAAHDLLAGVAHVTAAGEEKALARDVLCRERRDRLRRHRLRRPGASAGLRRFRQPGADELRDAGAVLFQHHHVAIAGQADFLDLHVLGLHARLVEPPGEAVIVFTVIATLAAEEEDRNRLQVPELAGGLGLHVAGNLARLRRPLLEDGS